MYVHIYIYMSNCIHTIIIHTHRHLKQFRNKNMWQSPLTCLASIKPGLEGATMPILSRHSEAAQNSNGDIRKPTLLQGYMYAYIYDIWNIYKSYCDTYTHTCNNHVNSCNMVMYIEWYSWDITEAVPLTSEETRFAVG